MSLDLKVPISSRILSITWTTTQTLVVKLRPFYSTKCCKWTVLSFAIKLKIRRPKQENHLGEAKKKLENANKTDWTPKHLVAWRLPTNLKPILPDVCEKNYFALFVPQPVENHTSAILCLSSCYNPCTTQSYKKKNLRLPCKHGRRIKQHFINFFHFWLRKHSNILNRRVLIKHSILLIPVQVRILNSFTTKIMKKTFNHSYA